jgi:hypothetical protein
MVTIVNDLRNFAFFLSIADLGVFTACVGAAVLLTRALPRWIGWAGLAVGALCVVSVAGAGSGAHNIGSMVQMVWWVVLGVLALRHRAAAGTPVRREAVSV